MFGYVTPVKEELRQQDFLLYRAFYCGICVETGRKFGALPRFFTGYDATFLAVLEHDYTQQSVEFKAGACVGNPFKKKAYVVENPLLTRVAAANVVLGFYKLCDDVTDGGGVKNVSPVRFSRRLLTRRAKSCPKSKKSCAKSTPTFANSKRRTKRASIEFRTASLPCFAGFASVLRAKRTKISPRSPTISANSCISPMRSTIRTRTKIG